MLEPELRSLQWAAIAVSLALSLFTAAHALLNKRDPRAALAWIAIAVSFPFLGPALYFMFGVNRVQTRGRRLRGPTRNPQTPGDETQRSGDSNSPEVPREYRELAKTSGAVTHIPLLGGNSVELLENGEQAYPAMLEAIGAAQHSVFLCSYIFSSRGIGKEFVDALAAACERGVTVRVLVDGFGELYGLPWISRVLKRRGVQVARFLPLKLLPPSFLVNLRNHRKILVCDGSVAFTGGMNIGDRHLAERVSNPRRNRDVHFRIRGPAVRQIETVFIDDWIFSTGESLAERYSKSEPLPGTAVCRTIVDGPNEFIDNLALVIVGAISAARRSVYIMTPYFLPSRELLAALQAAALRGVEVCIILPSRNNQPLTHWAARNMLWELLRWNVGIYYQPAPFVHSKLFVVDETYVLVGSANLDPRSLRLNFELALEIYDPGFARLIGDHIRDARARSQPVTLADIEDRSLPVRLRDAAAWLFSPYL